MEKEVPHDDPPIKDQSPAVWQESMRQRVLHIIKHHNRRHGPIALLEQIMAEIEALEIV